MTVWTVDTSKVWESLLQQALGRIPGVRVSRHNMRPPWQTLGRARQVDITLQHSAGTILIDAKYKLHVPGSSTADQYQLFAYSLLHKPAPNAVAMIYPQMLQADDEPSVRDATSGPLLVEKSGDHPRAPITCCDTPAACPLYLLQVGFPTRRMAQSESAWSTYLKTVADGVEPRLKTDAGKSQKSAT